MSKRAKNTPAKGETGCIEYYTVRQVAEILCVDRRTVRRMIEDKSISSTKPMGKRLIPKSEIHGLLAGSWTPARPPE